MHESTKRLYDAAKARGIFLPGKIAKMLGSSRQGITNWETRGVPAAVAVLAEEKFGRHACWILNGRNPSVPIESGPEAAPDAAEAVAAALEELGNRLSEMPMQGRLALEKLFLGFLLAPDSMQLRSELAQSVAAGKTAVATEH